MQISDHTLKNTNILKIITFIILKQLQLNFKFFYIQVLFKHLLYARAKEGKLNWSFSKEDPCSGRKTAK